MSKKNDEIEKMLVDAIVEAQHWNLTQQAKANLPQVVDGSQWVKKRQMN